MESNTCQSCSQQSQYRLFTFTVDGNGSMPASRASARKGHWSSRAGEVIGQVGLVFLHTRELHAMNVWDSA